MLFPKPTKRKLTKHRSRTSIRIYGVDLGTATPTMAGLRRFVLLRDGGCLLRALGYPGHECRGRWGSLPANRGREQDHTLEHVPAVHGPSDVRRDDPAHCVGLCYGTNVKPPSADERDVMRRHLRGLFPACPALATMFTGDGDG